MNQETLPEATSINYEETILDNEFKKFKKLVDVSNVQQELFLDYLSNKYHSNSESFSGKSQFDNPKSFNVQPNIGAILSEFNHLISKVNSDYGKIEAQLRSAKKENNELRELVQSMRVKNRLKRIINTYNPEESEVEQIRLDRISLDKLRNEKSKLEKLNNTILEFEKKNVKTRNENSVDDIVDFEDPYEKIIAFQESITPTKIKKEKLVSIIILNRDGLHHLIKLFSNWTNRTIYSNYEIIVVDNNSQDESVKYLNTIKDTFNIKIIENSDNKTFSYANNQAASVAKGEILLFLNNDVEVTKGWLTHLISVLNAKDNVGIVGSKLIYPFKENFDKSYKIQHGGITFKYEKDFIRPINMANGSEIFEQNIIKTEQRIALTAACFAIKANTFWEVGGFDESYVYGYEDVDISLKVNELGYNNYISNQSLLFHYEFGTQSEDNNTDIIKRRSNNINIFKNKWQIKLYKKLWSDKLSLITKKYVESSLHICFAVTENDRNTRAGDFFTAIEFGSALEAKGYKVSYLQVKNNPSNSILDDDIDILISMIDAYDISKIRGNNNLFTIAWARNWFERWAERPYIRNFDLILVSSQKAKDLYWEKYRLDSELLYIATNPERFNNETNSESLSLDIDICFTGSYWNAHRDIINYFEPSNIQTKKIAIYGENWSTFKKFRPFNKGFLNYEKIPLVYKSAKLLIDDSNHVTKEWGSVNSRVFDALASGTMVFTNGEKGSLDLFGGRIPVYNSEKELTDLLNSYLQNDSKRKSKVKELKEFVLANHTYHNRATQLTDILKDKLLKKQINIKVPAPNWNVIEDWGDFHLAKGLKDEFLLQGINVNIQPISEWYNKGHFAEANLVLRGLSKFNPPQHQYNVMWNISHPDKVDLTEYQLYDKSFVASSLIVNKLVEQGLTNVFVLNQCYDEKKFFHDPQKDPQYSSDILFVGNTRNEYRKIIKDLMPTEFNLRVFGKGWENFINEKYIEGDHIKNEELRKYYSSAKIVLNDHWGDMSENGFISNRIFDVTACSSFVVSDENVGLDELFGKDVIVQYKDSEDLKNKISFYLKNDNKRKEKTKKAFNKVLDIHSFKSRVKDIIDQVDVLKD